MSEKLKKAPRRVLIVDDSVEWRDNFRNKFTKAGVEATIVGSAEEAKELLEKGGFTEVITDGLGGGWTQVVESATGLPVRLVTSDSSLKFAAKSRGIGFTDKTNLEALRDIAK